MKYISSSIKRDAKSNMRKDGRQNIIINFRHKSSITSNKNLALKASPLINQQALSLLKEPLQMIQFFRLRIFRKEKSKIKL